jgi:RNA polymerase sigma-70 factor (ECF subfamily)
MEPSGSDWSGVLERLLAGDRLAFLRMSRLVTGVLVQLRAYDFEEEWEDLRQEVLASVVVNARAGRLRDPQAFVGYVRVITRNKFMDRLKRRLRCSEKETLPWEEESARLAAVAIDGTPPTAPELRRDVQSALHALSEEHRRIVEGVYLEGCTYREVSEHTGVPLGTLKRRLREALALLRARLGAEGGG